MGHLMGMTRLNFQSCRMAALFLFSLQSLADVARQEAERRDQLEKQGIEAKVITGDIAHRAPNGNLTTSMPHTSGPTKAKASSDSGKKAQSNRDFRAALQKLDRTIRQDQERLSALKERLQEEKWAPPKSGKISRSGGNKDSTARLKMEIDALESKLKRMRRERVEIYDAGRKAGFLPGELDGKGIIP